MLAARWAIVRVAAAGLLLTGCFYVDPIVEPPKVRISVSPMMERGGQATLMARFPNRDEQVGRFQWQLFACSTYHPDSEDECEDTAWVTGDVGEPTFTVTKIPILTRSDGPLAVAAVVQLEARDGIGAVANDRVIYALLDAPPVLDAQLRVAARALSVGAPIDLFARYSDPDSPVADVALTWTATPPATPGAVTWESPSAPSVDTATPPHATVGRRLIPGEPGTWQVDVVATSHGKTTHASTTIDVAPDQPPSLVLWQPGVPPPGATLPISASTLFEVLQVDDDLDAYPPLAGATQYGTAEFAWSILRPGAPGRQILDGATGNQLEFDPAAFTPGDVIELRVEVFDRQHRPPLSCEDSAPTCTVDPALRVQRQTWRVEIR